MKYVLKYIYYRSELASSLDEKITVPEATCVEKLLI